MMISTYQRTAAEAGADRGTAMAEVLKRTRLLAAVVRTIPCPQASRDGDSYLYIFRGPRHGGGSDGLTQPPNGAPTEELFRPSRVLTVDITRGDHEHSNQTPPPASARPHPDCRARRLCSGPSVWRRTLWGRRPWRVNVSASTPLENREDRSGGIASPLA